MMLAGWSSSRYICNYDITNTTDGNFLEVNHAFEGSGLMSSDSFFFKVNCFVK